MGITRQNGRAAVQYLCNENRKQNINPKREGEKNMIRYYLKQSQLEGTKAFGKWYAYPVKDQSVGLDELAKHMANHNSPYSAGAIKGILTDMVACVKELVLDGKSVKLPDLAIFSCGIKNKVGADTEAAFSVTENIKGLRLKARATGGFTMENLQATMKRVSVTDQKKADGGDTQATE